MVPVPSWTADTNDRRARELRRQLDDARWESRRRRQAETYRRYTTLPQPPVVYRDSYSPWFWLWLLDQTLDQRALWVYHHRPSLDEARYRDLIARDGQLEAKLRELEQRQIPRQPDYAPPGIDSDLMYTDEFVAAVKGIPTAEAAAIAGAAWPAAAVGEIPPEAPTSVTDAEAGEALVADVGVSGEGESPPGEEEPAPSAGEPKSSWRGILFTLAIVAFLIWFVFFKRWGGDE